MDTFTTHIAHIHADMLTNPTAVQLHEKCMDSIATPMANLGTDMLTNPISCSIVHEVHGFHSNSHCKPWYRHAYKPDQLFNCTKECMDSTTILQTLAQTCLQTLQLFNRTQKCMDPTAIPMANPGRDMLTNPTVVQLHAKMHGFYDNSYGKPWQRHAYKPYSCSIARKNAWILRQFLWQTLAETCLQTCLLYTSPSPRDLSTSRMPSSA